MSVNTELQNLLTKMGGSPSEEDSNSDLIKKISAAYEGGPGGGVSSYNDLRDRPFNIANAETVLFNETVTVIEQDGVYGGTLNYQQLIEDETITVVFDGTEYTCPLQSAPFGNFYGAANGESGPDFTEFPFVIVSNTESESTENWIITETQGTHTVIVKDVRETVTTTEDFDKAVASTASACKCLVVHVQEIDDGEGGTVDGLDKTWNEILAADSVSVVTSSTSDSKSWATVRLVTRRNKAGTGEIAIPEFVVVLYDAGTTTTYIASSANGYPIDSTSAQPRV